MEREKQEVGVALEKIGANLSGPAHANVTVGDLKKAFETFLRHVTGLDRIEAEEAERAKAEVEAEAKVAEAAAALDGPAPDGGAPPAAEVQQTGADDNGGS